MGMLTGESAIASIPYSLIAIGTGAAFSRRSPGKSIPSVPLLRFGDFRAASGAYGGIHVFRSPALDI